MNNSINLRSVLGALLITAQAGQSVPAQFCTKSKMALYSRFFTSFRRNALCRLAQEHKTFLLKTSLEKLYCSCARRLRLALLFYRLRRFFITNNQSLSILFHTHNSTHCYTNNLPAYAPNLPVPDFHVYSSISSLENHVW